VGGIGSTDDSSWLVAVDGEEVTNGNSPTSPVNGRLGSACVPSSGMVFLLDGVSFLSTGFEVWYLFDGVEGARLS